MSRLAQLLLGLPQELFDAIVSNLSYEDFLSFRLAGKILATASFHAFATCFFGNFVCQLLDPCHVPEEQVDLEGEQARLGIPVLRLQVNLGDKMKAYSYIRRLYDISQHHHFRTHLHTLELNGSYKEYSRTLFHNITSMIQLPCLQSLHLEGFTVTISDGKRILTNHAKTLRRLELCGVNVHEGCSISLITYICNTLDLTDLKLSWVKHERCMSSTYFLAEPGDLLEKPQRDVTEPEDTNSDGDDDDDEDEDDGETETAGIGTSVMMNKYTGDGQRTEVETLFWNERLTSNGGYREIEATNRPLKDELILRGDVKTQLTFVLSQGIYIQPRMEWEVEWLYGSDSPYA